MIIMTEEWDDDDFGTFESADASSPTVSETVIPSSPAPAWLLTAQQKGNEEEPIQKNEDKEKNTGEKFLEEILSSNESTNGKTEAHNQSQDTKTSDLFSSGGWQAFSSTTRDDHQTDNIALTIQEAPPPAPSGDNTYDNLALKNCEKTSSSMKEAEVQVDTIKENEEIRNLRGMLDNAVALKAHTEESLEELRKEMAQIISETQASREAKEQEHKVNIERLKENQENEINTLTEESQKTMLMLTEKYATLSNQASFQRNQEHEKNMDDVVEKCLEIMQAQSSILSSKLKEESASQTEAITSLIEACRSELKEFVTSECEAVVTKCEKIKNETSDFLKAEIEKEIERQREIDEKCKRDAMEELTRNLKTQLEETMKVERDKTAETIRSAVQDATASVRRSIEEDNKKSKSIRNQHVMALEMLLTSSQEHLRHLTESLPSNRKETE